MADEVTNLIQQARTLATLMEPNMPDYGASRYAAELLPKLADALEETQSGIQPQAVLEEAAGKIQAETRRIASLLESERVHTGEEHRAWAAGMMNAIRVMGLAPYGKYS